MFLAGQLLHRGAQTNDERRAAQFIRERFQQYTADVELDDFYSLDNYTYLFASYYAEFVVVAVLSLWWTSIAAVYGAVVFMAYLAEFTGYQVFSRFMPQFESQNVIARILAPRPERLFVVMAHYDSGCAHPFTHPRVLPWLRPVHLILVACMTLVVGTCAADALGAFAGATPLITAPLRWAAVAILTCAALAMFYAETQVEDIRGANGNASGVAAMLRLAERLAAAPLETADVWFLAAGSHEAWMAGARHFLKTQSLDKPRTYLLNIEGVGAGSLHYLTGEGMLRLMPANPAMIAAAARNAPRFNARPATLQAVPSGAHLPLARGYQTLTLMGLDEKGIPPHWNWFTDLVTAVDEKAIASAAAFAEALLRDLESETRSGRLDA